MIPNSNSFLQPSGSSSANTQFLDLWMVCPMTVENLNSELLEREKRDGKESEERGRREGGEREERGRREGAEREQRGRREEREEERGMRVGGEM